MIVYQVIIKQGEKEFRSTNVFTSEKEATAHEEKYKNLLLKIGHLTEKMSIDVGITPLAVKIGTSKNPFSNTAKSKKVA